jgi:uncharacterized membrane protein YgdD (TMEM256/DUF423 family)
MLEINILTNCNYIARGDMNGKTYIIISGVFGFLGVALGAFGAHGLRNVLTPQALQTYNTGVLYHLIHAAVLLALALRGDERFNLAYIFIAAGIILFSFSLYSLAVTGVKQLGIITPFGGVSFLLGWGAIIYEGVKK